MNKCASRFKTLSSLHHDREIIMKKGVLYLVTAPSGAGKTSLVRALVDHDDNLRVSISHTTRPPRSKEEDGVNYHFVTHDEFMKMLSDGAFLESAEVYGHHYGTSQKWVDEQLGRGVDVILEIDWQGAKQIRNLFPMACSIFVLPPSLKALRLRLETRAEDDEDTIERRMAKAVNEITHVGEADFIVINDDFHEAVEDMRAIVRANRLRVEVQQHKNAALLTDLSRG